MAGDRIRTAFVMAAGLGTRLRPLTEHRPKPLVPIGGRPLIAWCFDQLIAIGIERIVVNTHYLPDAFEMFFPTVNGGRSYRGCPVALIHEPVLLETGGGILNAADAIGDEPFLVCSGDVLTTIDLRRVVDLHFSSGADVTLAARQTGLASHLAIEGDRLIDIRERFGHVGTHDFANVSVWNPSVYGKIPAGQKISFIPVLLDWMADGGRVAAAVCNDGDWFNIGSAKEYFAVHQALTGAPWVDDSAEIDGTALVGGTTAVGAGSVVGAGAVLEDSLIWDRVCVEPGAHLTRCVVRDGVVVSGRHVDRIF